MAYGNMTILGAGAMHHTASAVYTGTAGKLTEIGMIWLHNGNTTNLSASMYWPNSSSIDKRFNELLASGETYEVSPKLPIIINGAGSLVLMAQQSASINYYLVGRVEA